MKSRIKHKSRNKCNNVSIISNKEPAHQSRLKRVVVNNEKGSVQVNIVDNVNITNNYYIGNVKDSNDNKEKKGLKIVKTIIKFVSFLFNLL